jgi:transketolase
VLSRQNLPVLPRGNGFASASEVAKGAYVLIDGSKSAPDVILIATGSEVQLAVAAREVLESKGISTRVVSAPCIEWFKEQSAQYQESVLPSSVKARVSVEAGLSLGWRELVGDAGHSVSIEHYGASADYKTLFKEFGITSDAVVAAAEKVLKG